jgi:hypothetical protein
MTMLSYPSVSDSYSIIHAQLLVKKCQTILVRETSSLVLPQFLVKPRARKLPVTLGGALRNPQGVGCFFEFHSHEKAQPHDFCRCRVFARELFERFINPQQRGITRGRGKFNGIKVHHLHTAATLCGTPPPSPVNEDAAHGEGRCTKEMRAVVEPRGLFAPNKLQPGVVNECGGLKCLPRLFIGKPQLGHAMKFCVDEVEELLARVCFAAVSGFQ